MANAITQTLIPYWHRVQHGPVGQFFKWWIEELEQAMPAAWRQRLQHALRRVSLQLSDGQLILGFDESRSLEVLERLPLAQAASLQQQQVDDLLKQNDLVEAPRFLLLDVSAVLQKTVRLPAAAENNLEQVLGFEMDRQTPFRAADVYFDYLISKRPTDGGQLELELYVVPRAAVDEAVKQIGERNFELAGVDVVQDGATLGLNLLPAAQRRRPPNPTARMNLALAVALVGLLVVVMAQSLYLRQHQLEELEEAIAAVQGEARHVMKIKESIADTSDAASFLARTRAATPLSIAVLADVTRILPDDTYLDRLVIAENSVQMQGKSQNAQQLIEQVNASPLLDGAEFRGSTRLDARSGLEIFEVNASVMLAAVPAAGEASE